VPKYSPVTGKRLIASLQKAGFLIQRVKGGHHFLRHPDGRTAVVPVHSGESLGPRLLAKVMRDVEITRNELGSLCHYSSILVSLRMGKNAFSRDLWP